MDANILSNHIKSVLIFFSLILLKQIDSTTFYLLLFHNLAFYYTNLLSSSSLILFYWRIFNWFLCPKYEHIKQISMLCNLEVIFYFLFICIVPSLLLTYCPINNWKIRTKGKREKTPLFFSFQIYHLLIRTVNKPNQKEY